MTKLVGEVDVNLSGVELDETINAGVRLKKLGEDMVPFFEEHTARLERGHSLESWYVLQPMERALIVAQRRLDHAMKAHQNQAEAKRMKQQAKKGARK